MTAPMLEQVKKSVICKTGSALKGLRLHLKLLNFQNQNKIFFHKLKLMGDIPDVKFMPGINPPSPTV
jgi:hypothetical protein